MKVLLIGSGGREHAIARALAKSQSCEKVYCSPGNPGIAGNAELVKLNLNEFTSIAQFCKENDIAYVFVGPEQPLAEGLADFLIGENIPVFGPTKAAAALESSKEFAKLFMTKYNIPTANFQSFSKAEIAAAKEYIKSGSIPVVIKADGLAAGKGVIIAETMEDALIAVDSMFEGEFGNAGAKIVIEEFMQGEEASLFAITDGKDYVLLAAAQDHKRIGEGDTGKNTGGMGAYAPAPIATPDLIKKAEELIIAPTIAGMQSEGKPFIGCIYAGLMIHNGEPKVVEFNCRFGDPETQAILSIFDGDFAKLTFSAAKGDLDKTALVNAASGSACCVVLASGGYPDKITTGYEIFGLNESTENAIVYHAGTKSENGKILSSGGRVLGVTGLGSTLEAALSNAYNAVNNIDFKDMYFRKDIAQKGLNK